MSGNPPPVRWVVAEGPEAYNAKETLKEAGFRPLTLQLPGSDRETFYWVLRRELTDEQMRNLQRRLRRLSNTAVELRKVRRDYLED